MADYSSSFINDIDEAEAQLRNNLQDVGSDLFNRQHIQLLEICISFQRILAPYRDRVMPEPEWQKIDRLLAMLDAYTKEHLDEEEKTLRESDYPEIDFKIHVQAHQIFRDMVKEYQEHAKQRDRQRISKLGFNLFDWFFWHINDMDAKYKDCLKD